MEIEKFLKKSWKSQSGNFSTAYHESWLRSCDNSIYVAVGMLQRFGSLLYGDYVLVSKS